MTRQGGWGSPVAEILEVCVGDVAVDGAGMSLLAAGAPEPVYGTDDVARTVEQLQFTLGEGPGVDATTSGSPVLVPDVGDTSDSVLLRWPTFLAEAADAGVRALFACPLRIGGISLGAVDFYRTVAGPLEQAQLGRALSTVDAVTLRLLDADGSLADALDLDRMHHLHVHQAAGMVMVQAGLGIEEALMRLRLAAYVEGVPIDDVARDVVDGTRRFREEQE